MTDLHPAPPDLASAVQKTWAALMTLDHNCHITDVNPAVERLAGERRDAMTGRRFCEIFQATPCAGRGTEECLFARALQGRDRRATPRWMTCTAQGRSFTALIGAASTPAGHADRVPERGASGAAVTMVPGTLVDDADRRRRELIATALHELRHTTSVQTMAVDMLTSATTVALPEELRPLLDTLRYATASLTTSLDDLLNRTLFELDAIPLQPRLVEVFPLLQGVVARLSPILAKRAQNANLIVPHDLHAWIDPTAGEQMVVNMLINAHKYSVDGDTITVMAREVPKAGLVEISVRDHGPGITVAERRRVFERYYRAARTRTRPGAGLGLAIVRSLAEQQGGSAGVRGPRGGGAQVWVRVPTSPQEGSARELARPAVE